MFFTQWIRSIFQVIHPSRRNVKEDRRRVTVWSNQEAANLEWNQNPHWTDGSIGCGHGDGQPFLHHWWPDQRAAGRRMHQVWHDWRAGQAVHAGLGQDIHQKAPAFHPVQTLGFSTQRTARLSWFIHWVVIPALRDNSFLPFCFFGAFSIWPRIFVYLVRTAMYFYQGGNSGSTFNF